MNRVYVLCLLTLAAVVLDIVLFHSGSASAQQQTGFRVDRIPFSSRIDSGTAPVLGHIVGFDCVLGANERIECFVASTIN